MDMGVKKPGRDAGHNRDKDKNKVDKRDNKFATDSRNGRSGQKNMLPKALQKPVHRQKDEKKEQGQYAADSGMGRFHHIPSFFFAVDLVDDQ